MSEVLPQALTYDDILIEPSYSEILPSEADTSTQFSRHITLNIPVVSAAMDTVTESRTAICMAQEGGLGVIHKNLSPEDQASEVAKVKRYESGMILDPITVHPDLSLHSFLELTRRHKITGFPVVDENKVLVGILTGRDMQFETNFNQKVRDVMTAQDELISTTSTDMKKAKELLHKHRIEKLPVVDKDGRLKGLITIKDIKRSISNPQATKDSMGRLRVAGAIGVGDKEFERASILVEAGIDALVLDTAHGHSRGVIEMVKRLKNAFAHVDVVAGNIATAAACEALIAAGVDGIKVGIGPGSICTTRVVAGIGMPQFSALLQCRDICHKHHVPYIADGGIKYSGDITKALAAGANCVMLGSLLAGCDESPGEMVLYQGRSYKVYRGMGSMGAMQLGSKDRYGQSEVDEIGKLVPEGIEGQIPYRGSLSSNLYQLVGGLRAGMGYIGAKNLKDLRTKARFVVISAASLRESHPHDVMITKEAPNYSIH
jgi:IMP dehydrogenase